jgi:ATP-dependent DNA ligase
VRLVTRTGLDWTHKYPVIAAAVASFGQAYLDGELCGVGPDHAAHFIHRPDDTPRCSSP